MGGWTVCGWVGLGWKRACVEGDIGDLCGTGLGWRWGRPDQAGAPGAGVSSLCPEGVFWVALGVGQAPLLCWWDSARNTSSQPHHCWSRLAARRN